ncbi:MULTISPECIES: DUF3119 family protein [unclassified Cyanobium]|uniref:DUF3119 family protein n=1 Tax=unclassified Cyanobium TaxID=2627006 RepID=UPI0020CFE1C8|nr:MULTISPECIES: DUF3119 family protein [unclassified Cyanobium]MCP9860422.1 DUF3119 family protein [Cyanobium sp. Cruz-8H5]MCP9867483.1 DUF3119 family protein [Cyanobium sp. Cruz-8D1]
MTTTPSSPPDSTADEVVLQPRFWVPLGMLLLAAASLGLRPLWGGVVWLALGTGVMGLFLLLQTALLRLRFAPEALLVARRDTVIRRFPYDAWIGWRVWWPALPVLFYFREEKSLHLLPMLFDATALRQQLELRLPPASPAPHARS